MSKSLNKIGKRARNAFKDRLNTKSRGSIIASPTIFIPSQLTPEGFSLQSLHSGVFLL